MNNVRRLLGGAAQRAQSPPISSATITEPQPPLPPIQTTTPLVISLSKPTWPPFADPATKSDPNSVQSPSSAISSTVVASPAHKDGLHKSNRGSLEDDSRPQSTGSSRSSTSKKPLPVSPPSRLSQPDPISPNAIAGPSSPARPVPSRQFEGAGKPATHNGKRSSGPVDTRDELLMGLLASEAMLDSRDFDIMTSEEVDELKKEYHVLDSRLSAMKRKLALEMRIRNAAASLVKMNAEHKPVSKKASEQLDAANRKVETVQKELSRLSERAGEINRRLLEHRAGVLSVSLKNLEHRMSSDTDESGYSTSFRSSQMSPTSSETSYSSSTVAKFDGAHLFAGHADAIQPFSPRRKPPTVADITALEEKLKEMSTKLHAVSESEAERRRELSHLQLEKAEAEASLSMELQAAEDKVTAMQFDLERLDAIDAERQELLAEKGEWERERDSKQRDIDVLERRLEMMEEKSGESISMELRVLELESAADTLRSLMHAHGVDVGSRDSNIAEQVSLLGRHLDEVQARLKAHEQERVEWQVVKRKLEDELAKAKDPRSRVQSSASTDSMSSSRSFTVPEGVELKKIITTLQPVWDQLPSPETRASKFGLRKGSPVIPAPGSPNTSLSELDVRLLKTLYDGRPAYQTVNSPGAFTPEAFAARVQSLIADDKALIERLVRFAQAHDLLKKNAERAQKLAQESSVALETYQKQVKVLEDRNQTLVTSVADLQDEIHELHVAIERVSSEKLEIESHAAEQAETCRQLTEANNALSAKTLSLAEEAASAPEAIRRQLEGQLSECKAELEKAQEEVHAMRTAERSQQMALMDELNSMQTENDNLRARLRAGGG